MALIAALEVLDELPSVEPALQHDRRYVEGVFLDGWGLGRAEIEDSIVGDPGVVGLVLNPPSSLRRSSPVLVGGVDGGRVRWVAPFSPARVLLGSPDDYPEANEELRWVFADFWDDLLFGLGDVIDDPVPATIWDPRSRFGNVGVELGASGTPVHPMIRLLGLEGGLWLSCPLSAAQDRRGRFFSSYSAQDVLDRETGGGLVGKRGLIEGKGGQVELAHFAVVSGSGWTRVGARLAAAAVGSIAATFADVWVRDLRGPNVWGRDLWACDPTVPLVQRCDGCRRYS